VRANVEVIDRLRAALAARDIVPPAQVIADGSIHGCDAAGKNGKGAPLVARIV
jgi:putative DNA primase/helicase